MKILFLIISTVICLTTITGQTFPDINAKFTTSQVNIVKRGNIHTYQGIMNLTADRLEIKGAKKIIHDTKTNKISAFGYKDYKMNGAINSAKNSKTTKLEYVIGDTIVYIK